MKYKKANALIFVFGLIFAASVLSVGIVEHTARTLKISASSNAEYGLRESAYSALYAAVAVLEEYAKIDGGLYSAEQGWGRPFEDGRLKFSDEIDAEISDESAKLPLCALASADIQKIFEGMDVSENTAREFADCIVDWRDNDDSKSPDGAEYDDYDSDAPKPPNRNFLSFGELKYVKNVGEFLFDENGKPNEFFKNFTSGVSLELFEKTNLNGASPETLKKLLDIENKDYDDTLYRALRGEIGSVSDGIVWVKNQTELSERGAREIPSKFADYKCGLLKIEIRARRGAAEYYLCAFYASPDTAKYFSENVKKIYNRSENAVEGRKAEGSSTAGAVYVENKSVGDSEGYTLVKICERGSNR